LDTSNLLPGDVSLKAQGAYVQDFPKKLNPTADPTSAFESDLIAYLKSYRFNELKCWSGENGATRSLCDELHQYNFESAKVILIPSTPGRISMRDDPQLGYLKLSQSIRKFVPQRALSMPIICQFSSIGSLSVKWLLELTNAWDAAHLDRVQKNPKNEVPSLSSSSRSKKQQELQPLQEKLMLVYPTVTEIRDSVEGYAGGGSVPGRRSNLHKPFLLPLYCKWNSNSPRVSLTSSSQCPNPLHKPLNVPHIKTYYQISQDDLGMDWFCISSHNLSKAAWGEVIQSPNGLQFFTRHWELGVFLAPSLFSKEKICPATTGDATANNHNILYVPLPFELRPSKYETEDQPWAVDGIFPTPDRFGQTCCLVNRGGY
jgi:tyrosyl-DNA phosphodiesterase 1